MSTSHNTLSLLETKGMALNVLVKDLNETFPPINPIPSDDMAAVMYRAGQRSVVEWILNKMDDY